MGKFGEIPVGYYTGIPDISVPIYEINTGTLKLPISVSYHAGGIRVEEVASWVGTGWALNAGGVITRQQRGLADEDGGGFQAVHDSVTKFITGMSPDVQQSYLDTITDGTMDSQMDIFTYNLGGESGKFFWDTLGNVVTIPSSRNKFEYTYNVGWKVTDINGTQYFFQTKESTQAYPVTNGSLGSSPQPSGVTSWYITKIVNALGTDSINFSYEVAESSFETIAAQTKYLVQTGDANCPNKTYDNSYSDNTVEGWRLTRIDFKNGS
ncbi:MAG TPA: hypothetical protein VGM41_17545, partial [Chitinophagaceae bacterium]